MPVPSLHRKSNTRRYNSAAEWPSWTDEIRFAPTDADAAFAAENLNTDWHTEDPIPDEVLDLLADEAEAQSRIERGHAL
jgi:hypothetical protein